MSGCYVYLLVGLTVIVFTATPLGAFLQSSSFLGFMLIVIGILFGIAILITWRIKRKQNGEKDIKERIRDIVADKEKDEHE